MVNHGLVLKVRSEEVNRSENDVEKITDMNQTEATILVCCQMEFLNLITSFLLSNLLYELPKDELCLDGSL